MISITRREISRAHRDHWHAYQSLSTASFSGLVCLFYTVECGLKALIMKQENKKISDKDIEGFGHDLNKMLDHLRCGKQLRLPKSIQLTPLKSAEQRIASAHQLNQVWRYGVDIASDTKDAMKKDGLVEKLEAIYQWLEEQHP